MTSKQLSEKVHFKQDVLLKWQCPKGVERVILYDTQTRGLACRITPKGTRTMFIYRKVAGRPVRKTLGQLLPRGKNLVQFRAEAEVEIGKMAADSKGYVAKKKPKDADTMTVQAAFDECMVTPRQEGRPKGETSILEFREKTRRFIKWLEENHKGVRRWVDLEREHIEEYHRTLEGRARNTKRLVMLPIKQTGKHMAERYGVADPAVTIKTSNLKSNPTVRVMLADVIGFLDFLKDQHPHLEAPAALQALAGLRMTEALRLRWRDYDRRLKWVAVAVEESKNEFSTRTIPLPHRAIEALERAFASRPDRSTDPGAERIAVGVSGAPYYQTASTATWRRYGVHISKAIKQYDSRIRWRSKDMRNCLPQIRAEAGIDTGDLEMMLGHKGGITATHYQGQLLNLTDAEAELVADEMQRFHDRVIAKIDALVDAHYSKQGPEAGAGANVVEVGEQ